MLNFNRQFLPKNYKNLSKDEQIKAKFLVVNAGSTVLWGPVMIVILYLLESQFSAIAVFCGFVISIGSIVVLKKTGNVKLSSSIIVIGLFCMFVAIALLNNGIRFGGLIWILILPLLALNAWSFRASLVTLASCYILVISLTLLDYFKVEIGSDTTAANNEIIYFISLLIVISLMLAIGVAYRNLSRRALLKERELNQAKSQFVSNVSHELRTPLNGIIGMVEAMKLQENQNTLKQDLHTIEYSGQHLLSIVNDILDLAEGQGTELKFINAPYRIKDNLNAVISSLQPLAKKKGLELTYDIATDIPDILIGDCRRIDQLVLNFLGNALKFTHQGWASLKVEVASRDFKTHEIELCFTVEDSGIGISEDDLKKLFDPFYQVDNSTTRNYGGTGLGLAISQKIIESLNGRIVVSSEVGKGSIFQFSFIQTLPTSDIVLSRGDDISSLNENIDNQFMQFEALDIGAKILIAEDNVVNQIVLRKMLEVCRHDVTVVNNGKEAIARLQENTYDLILLDGHMPELDGYSTAKFIRQELKLITPIIAVTAGAAEGDRLKCLEAGMNEVLCKPIVAKTLYRSIHYWLNQ